MIMVIIGLSQGKNAASRPAGPGNSVRGTHRGAGPRTDSDPYHCRSVRDTWIRAGSSAIPAGTTGYSGSLTESTAQGQHRRFYQLLRTDP
jgi:hypothetical protein